MILETIEPSICLARQCIWFNVFSLCHWANQHVQFSTPRGRLKGARKHGAFPLKNSLTPSAIVDCWKYQLSENSQNDTTCRLLMAISIHKRHRQKSRQVHIGRMSPLCWMIYIVNAPATRWWEVRFWCKHCTWLAKMDLSMIFWKI